MISGTIIIMNAATVARLLEFMARLYLVATAAVTGGLYLPLFLDPSTPMTFVPEAVCFWTVVFFVPFLVVERIVSAVATAGRTAAVRSLAVGTFGARRL